MNNNGLKFKVGNSKLVNGEATFALPSGWTCPGAKDCLSKANRETGKIQDGKHCAFRCFQASIEGIYKNTRNAAWHNLELLRGKSVDDMAFLIQQNLPKTFVVRVHVGGDFFSQAYLDAWIKVAKQNKQTLFYAYTKSLPFIVKRLGKIPSNLQIIASRGGKFDDLIDKHGLREAVVVYSKDEAKNLGLEIDFDDKLAQNGKIMKFALLIHGTQPKGSKAAKAWQKVKEEKRKKKLAMQAA